MFILSIDISGAGTGGGGGGNSLLLSGSPCPVLATASAPVLAAWGPETRGGGTCLASPYALAAAAETVTHVGDSGEAIDAALLRALGHAGEGGSSSPGNGTISRVALALAATTDRGLHGVAIV